MAVLLVSIAGLVPGQWHVALGAELLLMSVVIGGGIVRLPAIRSDIDGERRRWLLGRWSIRVAAAVPLVVAGISVLAESGGGLYWLVAGIVFAVSGAVANAWILLVEILH